MKDDMKSAFANGRGWYAEIKMMIEKLESMEACTNEYDEVCTTLQEGPLSVLVRDGWHQPGQLSDEGACEYEILLSTGGPALRIYGRIGDHFEPHTAELQAQDWGTPWTRVPDCDEAVLLAYAQQFYFG